MDELNRPQSQENSALPTPPAPPYETAPQRPPLRFTVKDWLFVPVALLLGWLCMGAYNATSFLDYGPAGLGVTVFVTALLAAVFVRLGKKVHLNSFSLFCTACAFLLGLSSFLGGNAAMYFINAFITLAVGILAVFSLSGQLRKPNATLSQFGEAMGLFFKSIFRYSFTPFRALGSLRRGDKKRTYGILIGLLCAIPVLAIVLALLISADSVFSGMFTNIGDWIGDTDFPRWLWKAVRVVLVGLLFFSGLYFLTQTRSAPQQAQSDAQETKQPHAAAPFVTVLVLLDIVYVVFSVIQIVFLFGGAETATMQGGYAQYARSGFFQLVAVTAINLCAVLLTVLWAKRCTESGRLALRVLALVLLGLTLIILASAVFRMSLYISVYALSMLRLLTLWAMFVILVSIFAAAWKTLHPEFNFWRVLFLVALCSWTLLSLIGPMRIIAEYNVSAFISGQVAQFDLQYFEAAIGWNGEILPALRRLQESGMYSNANELKWAISRVQNNSDVIWTHLHLHDLLPR